MNIYMQYSQVHFPCNRSTTTPVLLYTPKKSPVEHRTGNQFGVLLAWANTITLLHTWAGTAQLCTTPHISSFQSLLSLTYFFLHFIMFSCSCFPSVLLPGFVWLHQFIWTGTIKKHSRQMKCTQLPTNSQCPLRGEVTVFTISSCPLHQLRLSFAVLFSQLESFYTPLWIYFLL